MQWVFVVPRKKIAIVEMILNFDKKISAIFEFDFKCVKSFWYNFSFDTHWNYQKWNGELFLYCM